MPRRNSYPSPLPIDQSTRESLPEALPIPTFDIMTSHDKIRKSSSADEDQAPNPSLLAIFFKVAELCFVSIVNLILLPIYLTTLSIYGRPPTVPRIAQARRYLSLCWTANPSNPQLSTRTRAYITILLIIKLAHIPLWGFMWHLDEILYGRQLSSPKFRVERPIFVISGGRSGSTQISRYIEADERVEAPNILRCMVPCLWLWCLVEQTLGRLVSAEYVSNKIKDMMPTEALERHEMDPFKADTFDGAFWGFHYNYRAACLGPDVSCLDMNFARVNPEDSPHLERDFCRLVDRLARKSFLHRQMRQDERSTGADGADRPRFFIKGHFLWAADALREHYPDATFVTIVRDPAQRIQSGINFMHSQILDSNTGAVPWSWLSRFLGRSEKDYCRIEKDWYSEAGSAKRCVLCFDDFISDIQQSMRLVFAACDLLLENESGEYVLPSHVPKKHPDRKRHDYSVDRGLLELGIDKEELRTELAEYIAWCRSHSLADKRD